MSMNKNTRNILSTYNPNDSSFYKSYKSFIQRINVIKHYNNNKVSKLSK